MEKQSTTNRNKRETYLKAAKGCSPDSKSYAFYMNKVRDIEKKEKAMYLNTAQTNISAFVKYVEPAPLWDACDCDECCDYNDDEDNMNNTDTQDQRAYLTNRVFQAAGAHETKLREDFHINEDKAPATFDEFVARVKDGKLIFDKEQKTDKKWYYLSDMLRHVEWRDPAVPADRAGYAAAVDKMNEAKANVLDDVAILDPKEALASVRAFASQTFH